MLPRSSELEKTLDALLAPVLSPRRTTSQLADDITALPRAGQDFALRWTKAIANTNPELAFQFAAAVPGALATMDLEAAEAWVLHALDVYDRAGLHASTVVLATPADFAAHRPSPQAVLLEDVSGVLQAFVRALAGRTMQIGAGPAACIDGETLYLPVAMSKGASANENFLRYKALAALLWAQLEFGTFDTDLVQACTRFDDPARALTLLGALESVRLEQRIAWTLPGLARDMQRLHDGIPADPRCARLLHPQATVADSIALLDALYDAPPDLPDLFATLPPPEHPRGPTAKATRDAAIADDEDADPDADPSLVGVSESDADSTAEDETLAASAQPADPPFLYDEWDHRRQHYRRQWCALREIDVAPGDPAFVASTLEKHAPHVKALKRIFEIMRGEDRVLKREPQGDDIDLEAVVEAYADVRAGAELSSRLFTRRQRNERDIAVMFMVDMSGSTKGWVNAAEREALVMLCEALEVLGDRYAIYGFSGLTRRNCEIFRVKRFDEPYGDSIRGRIAGIAPHDYTRMGAAIRHLSGLLNGVAARTRLLVTLSDGKPDDYSDEYRGEYGIEDTRQALLEAHRSGIRPFCITIDREGRDYLPHLYGHVNWTLLANPAELPHRLGQIYGQLTR